MSRIPPGTKALVGDLFPDDDLGAILEAAEAVGQLQQHPGWAYVQKVIDVEATKIEARLNGPATVLTQAEYAQAHGRLGGIGYVTEVLDAIVAVAARRHAEQQRLYEGASEYASEGARA